MEHRLHAGELSNWKHENKVSQWTLLDIIASQDVTFSNKVFQVSNQYSIHTFLDAMIELIRLCLLLCDVQWDVWDQNVLNQTQKIFSIR